MKSVHRHYHVIALNVICEILLLLCVLSVFKSRDFHIELFKIQCECWPTVYECNECDKNQKLHHVPQHDSNVCYMFSLCSSLNMLGQPKNEHTQPHMCTVAVYNPDLCCSASFQIFRLSNDVFIPVPASNTCTNCFVG